jgi:hypothetical protein
MSPLNRTRACLIELMRARVFVPWAVLVAALIATMRMPMSMMMTAMTISSSTIVKPRVPRLCRVGTPVFV